MIKKKLKPIQNDLNNDTTNKNIGAHEIIKELLNDNSMKTKGENFASSYDDAKDDVL